MTTSDHTSAQTDPQTKTHPYCANCFRHEKLQDVTTGYFAGKKLCYGCWLNRRAIVRAINTLRKISKGS